MSSHLSNSLNDFLLSSNNCMNGDRNDVAIGLLYCNFTAAMLRQIETMKPHAFGKSANRFCDTVENSGAFVVLASAKNYATIDQRTDGLAHLNQIGVNNPVP